jgi:bifunctional UDP-N-acetylglucosamine pyrophosphorylase/glucosamine-1-phosphate N-acetyltransferase
VTELAAIVLAAGRSKRMNSALPKVLHPILGVPLVVHVLEAAVAAGVTRIVLVANADNKDALAQASADWITERRTRIERAAAVSCEIAIQETPRGTADAVLSARAALAGFSGTAVVLCGDVPCVSASSIEALLLGHSERKADLSVLSGDLPNPTGYGRIVRGPDGDLAAIVEEKDATPERKALKEINSGILALELPRLWDTLSRIAPSATTGELYLTEAVVVGRNEKKRTIAVRAALPEDVLGVNDRSQLAECAAVLRHRVNVAHMKAGVTIVDPATAFIDTRVQIGRDTTIMPFVVIEGPCVIGSGVRVGPFAHVRGGSTVGEGGAVGNFVEVVRSHLGANTRALHLAYLGDTDMGEKTNVGAGTIVANFDGVAKHRTSVGSDVALGAGTVLVAPCVVAKGARTGAGAIVTAGNTVPAGETWAGVPARRLDGTR